MRFANLATDCSDNFRWVAGVACGPVNFDCQQELFGIPDRDSGTSLRDSRMSPTSIAWLAKATGSPPAKRHSGDRVRGKSQARKSQTKEAPPPKYKSTRKHHKPGLRKRQAKAASSMQLPCVPSWKILCREYPDLGCRLRPFSRGSVLFVA
jgi:hypothetical protein